MRIGYDEHDGAIRVDENTVYSITLGGSLIEVMKQLAEEETLVDILTVNSSIVDRDTRTLERETHGVRIILVGEDHLVLGPKRPVFSCFLPFDEILMVKISQQSQDADKEHVRELEEDDEDGFLIPDGTLHLIDPDDFEDAISDTSVVVVLITEESEKSKIIDIMEELAETYEDDVLFIHVFVNEDVMCEIGVDQIPSVVILSDDEIFSQIVGIGKIKKYRKDIDEALDCIEEDDCDEC